MQHCSTSAQFHWQRSDNSFAFNFSPEIAPSLPQSIMDPNESHPGHAVDSEASSGFAFNFQIPAGAEQKGDPEPHTGEQESDPEPHTGKTVMSEAAQGSESTVDSKPKSKKKKKSGVGGREVAVAGNVNKMSEEAPKQESTELVREEASRALKTLRSSKAPIVKKRQVMRAVSGDYRKKMEEDRERQYKMIRSVMSTAKVMCVSEPRCRGVYHRQAETRKAPARSTDTSEASLPAEQTDGARFVFRPSGEEFHFNFNL
ncbi:hypothetical protein QTP70_017344 [Hemibagrus guttatus]|uniref:Uncharacterized protein n=1 Tax=Hemibagrus guttatus TaxID=175788 RepID=A0AAE0VA86_9TELE|nr:hypothetical protein QTP70_017344 [Hemibagrus guttatus]KAK3571797.1 hypothetical protein QTP86_018687 [Hemibagrus guttatus]